MGTGLQVPDSIITTRICNMCCLLLEVNDESNRSKGNLLLISIGGGSGGGELISFLKDLCTLVFQSS